MEIGRKVYVNCDLLLSKSLRDKSEYFALLFLKGLGWGNLSDLVFACFSAIVHMSQDGYMGGLRAAHFSSDLAKEEGKKNCFQKKNL